MRKRLLFAAALLIAGCSSTPSTGPEQPGAAVEDRSPGSGKAPSGPGATTGQIQTPGVATVTPLKAEAQSSLAILKDPKSILSKRSIYFDLDSFVIKDEFKPMVEAHAKFLAANQSVRMLIQGNTDERGSREYNVALGQRRADAIKRALVLLGAKEDQIEAVSLGEEKPRNPGHEEDAWTENRRGDMLYSGEF